MVHRPDIVPLRPYELLGFTTHPGTALDYLAFVERRMETREPTVVLYHNLHTLHEFFTHDDLRRAFADTIVIVDGMGVVLLYKLAGVAMRRDYRLTYVDFVLPMMTMARDHGWRVFHVGQRADVLSRALDVIRRHAPGIEIDGHDGYFDRSPGSGSNAAVLRRIDAFAPDLLLVGLGTPAQETWIDAHRHELPATMIMSCGSCMEYLAGEVSTAPRWVGRAGLEWLYRLFHDPRRFAFRYLVQPFLLARLLWRERGRGTVDDASERRS